VALREAADAQAAELYMEGVTGTSWLFSVSMSTEAISVMQFLSATTAESESAINELAAGASELERLGVDLDAAVEDLTGVRDAQASTTAAQEDAMAAASAAYDQLSDECRELQAEYQAEQARKAAEEEARRRRESQAPSNGGGATVGGIICPFTPGRTNFIDSWGYPRSGGRRHKGADMFAPMNEPVYAVASGTVSVANGGIGGKTIWLRTGSVAFYYAHLNDWAVESGQRVEQGQLIAYNGNTGNARGTSPHVHFQIHPSGRGAINPYTTVASVCF
jgi:murein DD-endopeptidase MepM/ murein hydrolase activator NlpD